jgi:cytochrome b pre-mRNA-processing protein 3
MRHGRGLASQSVRGAVKNAAVAAARPPRVYTGVLARVAVPPGALRSLPSFHAAGRLARASSGGAESADKSVTASPAADKRARRQHEVGLSETGSRFEWLLKWMGYYGKESKIIRSSGILYLNAREVASSPEFLKQFELEQTWENEFYVNCLHLWIIFVRIRKEGPAMKQLSQEVFDNFWQDMQKGMYHNLGVQSLALNTRTRELQNVFYGSAVSYDFALGTSDAVLGAALYRNLFGLEGRAVHVNKMAAYVRKQLQMLEVLPPSSASAYVCMLGLVWMPGTVPPLCLCASVLPCSGCLVLFGARVVMGPPTNEQDMDSELFLSGQWKFSRPE